MPPSVRMIAASVNTAFMAAVVDALHWLDSDLVKRFVFGFPVAGIIPDSGVYRPLPSITAESAFGARWESFVASTAVHNRILHTRLRSRQWAGSDSLVADSAVATKSDAERGKGVIRGPFYSVDALHDSVASLFPHLPHWFVRPRIMPRFGVKQKGTIRAIDDGKSSGTNAATLMLETVTTPNFFFSAVVARAFSVAAAADGVPPPAMTVALADLTMAYRCSPSAQPWFTSIGFFNPDIQPPRPQYYYLPGHNFGLASAVVNFNRYPELVVVAARALAAVPVDHYYDDFIILDLAAGEATGLEVVQLLVSSFGRGSPRPQGVPISSPELDPLKTLQPASSNVVLGVVSDLSDSTDGTISFHVSEERVSGILEMWDLAFEKRFMSPHVASSIRGKTYFTLSAGYAMVGRAATLTLMQRQYRDVTYGFYEGSELYQSYIFFKALLPRLPHLTIDLLQSTDPPVIVYTDASFWVDRRRANDQECSDHASMLRGGLGAVVYDTRDQSLYVASAAPPWSLLLSSWRTDRKTYIAELETLAAVAVYSTLPDLLAGRKVMHWIDNTVALSALVHGYSGKPDLAKSVNIMYLQMAALRTSIYFDYVPSKANIADVPSRLFDQPDLLRTELLYELRGLPSPSFIDLRIPSVAEWLAPLDTWLDRFDRPHTTSPT